MERINKILQHKRYQKEYKKIEEDEKDRIYCKHDMQHFLDAARIAMILNLESNLLIPKDLLYATALLHDIGRHREYKKQDKHERSALPIARDILKNCNFTEAEIMAITDAIENHGNPEIKEEKSLRGIFYRADKAARGCFCCKAYKQCDWPDEKKNATIQY